MTHSRGGYLGEDDSLEERSTSMKSTEEMIAVMKAHVDGEQIEYAPWGCNVPTDCWLVLEKDSDPNWDWQKYDYRVHPLTDSELLVKIRHILARGGSASELMQEIDILLNPDAEEEYDEDD